jgi:DNA-binding transcriptional LysR family regulator
MDNLNETRTFLAVADALSFAAAARRLRMSAAQASKLVSRLEERLGVRLLNRTTRDVSLTDAGTNYAVRARTVVDEFDALETSARDGVHALKGTLKIAAPVSFASAVFDEILMEFAKAERDLTLEVSYADRAVNIVEEGYDVAVRVGAMSDSSLVAKKLGETRILCSASVKYLSAKGTPKKPEQLADHSSIIDLNARDPFLWVFRDGRRESAVRVSGRLRFSRAETCLRAARLGFGIARSPAFAAVPYLRSGALVPVLETFEPEPLPINAIYPHARHLPAKVRAFLDFLGPRMAKALKR